MPGIRSTDTRTPLLRPQKRMAYSACTRRWARGVWGASARVSATRAPWQSPYTPLVDAYTTLRGALRRRKMRVKARARGSVQPSEGGGARYTTRWARPARRRRVWALSRLPTRGVAPNARKAGMRSTVDVSASQRPCGRWALSKRTPTSPQPSTSTRSLRKREGKAPRGDWFEGKIEG